jgi:long-chain alkane monooxygenase
MPKKAAHLLGFIQHGVNSHATGMWRHPEDKINWDWSRPAYWQHMARTMERGLFDAVFIAYELAPYNNYEGSSDATVKYAVPELQRRGHRKRYTGSTLRESLLAY